MAHNRFFRDTTAIIAPYVNPILPALRSATRQFTELTPVQHVRQGVNEFIQVLDLWDATRSRAILEASLKQNILHYLLPVVLFSSLINTFKEHYVSDNWDGYVDTMYYVIMATFFLRIYLRALLNNTFYSITLPCAIGEDVKDHLCDMVSELLSHEITLLLTRVKCMNASPDNMEEKLYADVKALWKNHFQKMEVKPETLATFAPALHGVLKSIFKKYHSSMQSSVAKILAQTILHELTGMFVADANKLLERDEADLLTLLPAESVRNFFGNLKNARAAVSSFLPINHTPGCRCKAKDLAYGSIASPFYFSVSHAITYIPKFLYKREIIFSDTYLTSNFFMTLASILIYGQVFAELRITQEGQCTEHRYEIFSRNRAYNFGLGLGFWLSWQLAIQAIQVVTGVNNYYTSDALLNILLQAGTTTILAFNHPFPGKGENNWDLFYLPKEITNLFYQAGVWLSKPRKPAPLSYDKTIKQIKSGFRSVVFRYLFDLVYGGGDYFPRKDLFIPASFNIQDGWQLLFDMPSFRPILKYYKTTLENGIVTLKQMHFLSTWTPEFVLHIPVPGFFTLIIFTALKLMKNEELDNLLRGKRLEEILAYYRSEIDANEFSVTLSAPAQISLERFIMPGESFSQSVAIESIPDDAADMEEKPAAESEVSPLNPSADPSLEADLRSKDPVDWLSAEAKSIVVIPALPAAEVPAQEKYQETLSLGLLGSAPLPNDDLVIPLSQADDTWTLLDNDAAGANQSSRQINSSTFRRHVRPRGILAVALAKSIWASSEWLSKRTEASDDKPHYKYKTG
jgi:hypothetical protein